MAITRLIEPRRFATTVAMTGLVALLAGCAGSQIRPAEVLDERTGVTVGALEEPIEFVENADSAPVGGNRRTSFAYLGPVEWDRSGDSTYGLWLHVAPGNDRQVGDIRIADAVTLKLDDDELRLLPLDTAPPGDAPYKAVASWGQTAYFKLDVAMLQRIAASQTLALDFAAAAAPAQPPAADASPTVKFVATRQTHATLQQYLQARGLSP